MLNIQQTTENDRAVLTLSGRLDTLTAPELEQKIKDALPDCAALTIDMASLEYVSSAGLRVLLSAHKAFSAKGGLTLTHVSEAIMEILDVTGFSDILTIE
jgi:anti-sigma B factor antagonist